MPLGGGAAAEPGRAAVSSLCSPLMLRDQGVVVVVLVCVQRGDALHLILLLWVSPFFCFGWKGQFRGLLNLWR